MGSFLLGVACLQGRVVSASDFHDTTDVDDSIEKVVDDLGELADHEQTVHVHAVARQDTDVLVWNVALDVGEQLFFHLGQGLVACQDFGCETAIAVVLDTPLVHFAHHLGTIVDNTLVVRLRLAIWPLHGREMAIGDNAADLDDPVVHVVQAGHLAIDPDQGLEQLGFKFGCLSHCERVLNGSTS